MERMKEIKELLSLNMMHDRELVKDVVILYLMYKLEGGTEIIDTLEEIIKKF